MVDTSKKSNIKCEHCDCWNRGKCNNEYSPKWNTKVNYWNRCKEFDWNERIKQEIKMRTFAINELETERDKLLPKYRDGEVDEYNRGANDMLEEIIEHIDNRILELKGK